MLNFLLTIKNVITNITLIDLVKAFGDNSITYYNNDPELIKSIIQLITNAN